MLNNWFLNHDTKLTNFYQNLDENSIGLHVNFFDDFDNIKKDDVILFSDDLTTHQAILNELYTFDNSNKHIKFYNLGILKELNKSELNKAITTLFETGARILNLSNDDNIQNAIFEYQNNLSSPYNAMRIASKTINPNNLPLSSCKKLIEFGIQGHLCNINKRQNDVLRIRLGSIKRDLNENEPYCRNQDYVILDCNAIKHQDFPGHKCCGPAGFTAEELTKIFRYLGFNQHLRAITIKGYQNSEDFNAQGAKLIAQIIWYYMNALNECIKENIHNEDYTEYVVDLTESDEHLTFRQGKKSLRWWLKDHEHNSLIPCSYNDYQLACNNEIPNRLFL